MTYCKKTSSNLQPKLVILDHQHIWLPYGLFTWVGWAPGVWAGCWEHREMEWPDPCYSSGCWGWSSQSGYGAQNFKGCGENHKNPISKTCVLLQGKLCKNFPFDFCYPNNSCLNWNLTINLIMTWLRCILWQLISNDLQGFTLPHCLHSFPARSSVSI